MLVRPFVLSAVALLVSGTAVTASAQVEGPGTVRVVVRAESKGEAAPLQPADVKVEFDGKKIDAARIRPLVRTGGQPIEVAVLLDDGLRGNFGSQLRDVEDFIDATASPQVAVGIGYMRNGVAVFPAGFSTEPEQEKKAVRLPLAARGVSGSPYFCLQELVKHWPTNSNAPRVVLMITNGIDYYNGSVSPMNQDSPYVSQAVTDAQRAGVPVYSIYYGGRDVNAALPSFSGQSYLSQVGEGTGGDSFNGGQINPPSLSPYFKQFNRALRESFVLSFQTSSMKLERLKVSTKVSGVKLRSQNQAMASQ
jgi:hypothetical protein